MGKKFYLRHTDNEVPDNGTAYFGPFDESEIQAQLDSHTADMFADSGPIDAVQLTKKQRDKLYINTREYWLDILEE